MLKRTTDFFVNVAERWMPDPLVIAIFLTGVALAAALMFTDFTAGQAVEAWGNSYWALLRFTAQMILILALGHVLASTRAVRRLLVAAASLVKSARMAYVGLTLFASLAALVSWGLGLIVPAVLSRIIADNCRERLGVNRCHAGIVSIHSAGFEYARSFSRGGDRTNRSRPDDFLLVEHLHRRRHHDHPAAGHVQARTPR
jgi:short-chain fatty acids transporter